MQTENTIIQLFTSLYGLQHQSLIRDFIAELKTLKSTLDIKPTEKEWYKDAVVYSLYVDLFNKDFQGLTEKLDYIRSLGANTLWLLPILDSPMRDAGFDIRDYRSIRRELFSLPADTPAEDTRKLFRNFLDQAHDKGLRVIFDIAMNHTSNEHPWFIESRKGPENPYRDYYIWNKDTNLYKETRLLFKGLCPSNWEYDNGWYFFHRFYEFQPDLNYRNPKVLIEISRILVFWLSQGVDGFRADAIPFIWKEDGTDCENLPQTHTIVKFFRAVLDFLRPGTLLLAEACQPPIEVVKYFGEGDECHAGYHFPLMPQIFISMAMADARPVQQVLSAEVTPSIPPSCQWFTFLRLHDELTLEMVTPAERDIMNSHYRHDIRWNFREGEGISARLAELFKFDERRILQAYSIMLTLPGTPVIYYGDELGKGNDEAWFDYMTQITGHPDSRFYVRGPIDWQWAKDQLSNPESFTSRMFNGLNQMLKIRNTHSLFGHGILSWETPLENLPNQVIAWRRIYNGQEMLAIHNLANQPVNITLKNTSYSWKVGFSMGMNEIEKEILTFEPYGFAWLFNIL
ncbi:MAG: maltose alpha-D-glucosyltransferase / alpha-amylase [Bacteroidales bacterium]|jgi:maltose alpha-D-glucosyltransferase/alpha-amylase|nr:maltose alpha-D-glucosyltransferase / alpha-amylase [Bacteroidales bacterium]MDN5329972.1 maltose alpha-D-glucosyltransferase / alpha-amylase [Bacteroidales bacterium]